MIKTAYILSYNDQNNYIVQVTDAGAEKVLTGAIKDAAPVVDIFQAYFALKNMGLKGSIYSRWTTLCIASFYSPMISLSLLTQC